MDARPESTVSLLVRSSLPIHTDSLDSSKFALTTQPLNTAIQGLLGIDRPLGTPEELAMKMSSPTQGARISLKGALGVLQRIAVTLLSVAVSILVPEFSAASEHPLLPLPT